MAKKETKTEVKKRKALHVEVVTQMLTLATSGFGLVSALAWNSLIQEVINNYVKKFLPGGSGLLSMFIYAAAVTCLAVLITLHLSQLKERLDR